MTPALPPPPATGKRTPRDPHGADERVTCLALAARSGDAEAVDRFIRALHHDVRRYVAFLSPDPQAADDLTQDTFLRALGSLHRFEGRSSARTWLLSIARRTVVDSLRHAAARPRLADRHDWQSAAERSQPRGLPGFDDGIALADLLAAVPAERREAFVLTQLLGLRYAEAAAVTGTPVGTVRSRVARARSALVELLREAEAPAARPSGTGHGGTGGAPRPVPEAATAA
ncbi:MULTISPECIES: sigma-70 family RNA polymerase sigma factor [Streptomyces]|uniref:sigma-70 family RNA polymerase sigma factor n=1 Tax=Streptomyces TaxID=1883 RepID=UPI000F558B20|nr:MULTISPECIES: sigma-70 family RNA polymerase sigma factor [Streptomyces]MDX3062511.1 sigma-70 family RNA polymerase sigma factor [Streptomyces sp. ND04-05B]RPK73620.1 ECF RNA polymerase sigma factor SigC [Streptomyces sp. ADI97-07]WRY80944.1 sigma-70 family RNA polymerase sigma factor [Streptomyces clavifer]WUC26705.1 sigma-70 family RNA polymerase sigma factor [Streptomyces clavifer]